METTTGGIPAAEDPRLGLFGLGLSQRSCLAPLFSDDLKTPKERLAWVEEQLVGLAQSIAAAKEELTLARAKNREIEWQNYVRRYHLACFLVYLEEERLLSLRQCRGLTGYIAVFEQLWPGKKISDKQVDKYLGIARHVPEHVALSGHASLNTLWALSGVRPGECFEMLCGLILSGDIPKNNLKRGAEAARQATRRKLPDDQVLALAREAVAAPARDGSEAAAKMEELLRRVDELESWRREWLAQEQARQGGGPAPGG